MTAAAISSDAATRLNGLCPRISAPRGELSSPSAMSVSTYPGATLATAIRYGASARAIDCPNAFSPALVAPYAGCRGSPRNAPREVTLMIRPPACFMCCTAHQVTLAAPVRLTARVSRQASCHCS
jgi:hypothetical protein